MFTLYRTVKWNFAETVLERVSVQIRYGTFGTISAPEQDYFAPLRDVIPATQRSTPSCSHCT